MFGRKKQKTIMKDVVLHVSKQENINDFVDDLHELGELLLRHDGFNKGNRIVTAYNVKWEEDEHIRIELYVDKLNLEDIKYQIEKRKFKTIVGIRSIC